MVGQGGTKARTYAEVLDALYPLAAQIHVTGDKESLVFSGTVHRDNVPKFADLLAEQMLTPRFAEEDFTRNKQDALDYVTKTLRGNGRRGSRQAGHGDGALPGAPVRHARRRARWRV